MDVQLETDQMNLILLLDEEIVEATSRLAPHLWAFSIDEPRQISGSLALQGPIVDTVVNWLHEDYLL